MEGWICSTGSSGLGLFHNYLLSYIYFAIMAH